MNNTIKGMKESVNLSKTLEIGNESVVVMNADIRSDPSQEMQHTVTVVNHKLYTENLELCREGIKEFKEIVRQREDFIFDMYTSIEEEPEEVEETDNPEESTEPETPQE